jgi:hypothetical protein
MRNRLLQFTRVQRGWHIKKRTDAEEDDVGKLE